MNKVKVTFPDGSVREFEKGVELMTVAKDISEGLARTVLGAVVNDAVKGLQERVEVDSAVRFVKFDDPEGKEIFWHTSSHIMAAAVKRLFPDTTFAIGPAIDTGFYYDMDTEHRFVPEDLPLIEKEMAAIVKEGAKLERIVMSRDEALAYFRELGEVYKVDLIDNLPAEEEISLYKLGDFADLCRTTPYDVKKLKR